MSNVCKHQCPILSGVCNPVECEVIRESNRELKSDIVKMCLLKEISPDLSKSEMVFIMSENQKKLLSYIEHLESLLKKIEDANRDSWHDDFD